MENKPREKNEISLTQLNNLTNLDPTLTRIIRVHELGREKIMQFIVPTDLEGERTQFSSPARCIPSRAVRERLMAYQKEMIATRGKFIEKYPVLNPAPPKK